MLIVLVSLADAVSTVLSVWAGFPEGNAWVAGLIASVGVVPAMGCGCCGAWRGRCCCRGGPALGSVGAGCRGAGWLYVVVIGLTAVWNVLLVGGLL